MYYGSYREKDVGQKMKSQLSRLPKCLSDVALFAPGPHENATVTKKCSLAPCNLDDDALGFARQCDVSKDSYVCSSCCKENACNAGADNKNHATCVTNVLLVTLVLPKMAQSCFLSGSPSLRPG